MRAFIGIDFQNELKDHISELQQNLRKYAVRGRWKHRDNFHLTLKFLDEISLSHQRQIDEGMKELCKRRDPFTLGLSGLGIFKGKDDIRVLWMGLVGDIGKLESLQKDIDDTLYSLGFPPEKRSYKPHITIGQNIVFPKGFEEVRHMIGDVYFSSFEVKNLFLFKSEQAQNKRIYTKVSEYGLGKGR